MKQLRLPIFTSKIKVYNLRIVPPEPAFNEVEELKKQFESLYGKQPLSKSKPHITIASFKMNSKHQDFLIHALEQLSKHGIFTLHIHGFDVFEGSRTLYLNVSKSKSIEIIHDDVKNIFANHLRGKVKQFIVSDNPHITLSKTASKKMLYESLQHFQQKGYSKAIEISHLTLVSRTKYRTWDWGHEIKLLEAKRELDSRKLGAS